MLGHGAFFFFFAAVRFRAFYPPDFYLRETRIPRFLCQSVWYTGIILLAGSLGGEGWERGGRGEGFCRQIAKRCQSIRLTNPCRFP